MIPMKIRINFGFLNVYFFPGALTKSQNVPYKIQKTRIVIIFPWFSHDFPENLRKTRPFSMAPSHRNQAFDHGTLSASKAAEASAMTASQGNLPLAAWRKTMEDLVMLGQHTY